MKKLFLALVCFVSLQTMAFAFAGDDKPVQVTDLPAAAQQLIKKYFAGNKVALAKMERDLLSKSYDVVFTNGDKLEFDSKGQWTEIKCTKAAVPADLVPAAIGTYVKENYSGANVLSIEKDDNGGYDVRPSNRVELEFNKNFQLTDID